MLPSFCKDQITRIRPTLTDKRGTQVLDWATPNSLIINGCSVQPVTTSRDFDGRTVQVSEEWTLYAPPNSDIKAGDRIEWRSITFEINGSPMPWESPTGRVSHIYARLSEWSG